MQNFKQYLIFTTSALLIFFVIIYVLLALYIARQAEKDTKSKSDVILVTGARSYIGGEYNPCLKARVDHAVDLYKSKLANKILMTGGNDIEDNVNEAEIMKKITIENGVISKDILLEKRASSTYENFTFSQDVLKRNGLKSVIIVTEPFHITRAEFVAQKLNYNFSVSPAINSPCWSPNHYFTKYFLKEPFAIIWYKIENKL